MKKKGKYLVITAELVPEAEEVEDSKLESEIREEVEKSRSPGLRRS